MDKERLAPYPADPGPIGAARTGVAVALAPMTTEAARQLGPALAGIDPWASAGYGGERLRAFFEAREEAATRYRILADGALAGVMVVRLPWLHGPYLHFLGLLPEQHGRGIGSVALAWLEAEAQGRFRNLWLCVTGTNAGARRFYAAHGFRVAASLEGLVLGGQDEILMRKRLA